MIYQLTDLQLLPFWISAFILIASIVTFHFDRKKLALCLLFLGALGLGFFIANLDNYLLLWDEQFHALVAKNMSKEPFKPMLYTNPLLDYNFKDWSQNHIWVHKQPLFLWQMALSIKLFGANVLAVRLPSIIMHAFTALMIYRIGKIASNARIGFYGALFFTCAYHFLELSTGQFPTDHNDIAFLFYVTASIWAWFEYQDSKKTYWIVLIGLFSGCAILVKWLVGLLVYALWGVSLGVEDKKNWLNLKAYIPILKALIITIIVFIPWQIYILNQFPIEANYEFQFNTAHFFHALEAHEGDLWFHINALKDIYGIGEFVPYVLLAGLIVLILKTRHKIYRAAILTAIIVTYVFFTIAATKMTSFCIVVACFGFLSLGALLDTILTFVAEKIKIKPIDLTLRIGLTMLISYTLLEMNKIEMVHTNINGHRAIYTENMEFIERAKQNLDKNGKYAIFNVTFQAPVMFYTDFVAYKFIPSEKDILQVKKQSYKIVVQDNGQLPDYIYNDDSIVKLK